jgi:DNA-binding NarL/FixJ family response regulator
MIEGTMQHSVTSIATNNKAIRVLVMDDSEAMRYSLHQCIAAFTDLEWVGEASALAEALAKCEQLQPRVVLIDVSLSHVDVADTTRQLRQHFPLLRIIATVGFEDQSIIQPILEAGAELCLPKHASVLKIAESIRQIGAYE